jgi:di/tricarboxylate transporter
MILLVSVVFALTYVGMALGRVPGFGIDRNGIAMIAAVMLVAVGALPVDEIAGAIHFPTLLLLGGLMILSARPVSTMRPPRGSPVRPVGRCACWR